MAPSPDEVSQRWVCPEHGLDCPTPVVCQAMTIQSPELHSMPESPMSPAEATGHEFFSVYAANLQAGFSPPQSLYLLAVQMSGNPGIAPGFEEPDPRNT